MKVLLELSTNHPDATHATKEWILNERGKIICPECNSINRAWYPRPVDVVLRWHPGHMVTSIICLAGSRIFHKDFIDQIGSHLASFVTGKCLLPNGTVINDYVTCYTNQWIVKRGGKGSVYRECQTCGAIYPSGEVGPQYTLRAYLSGAPIHQDAITSLYLDEDLAMELDFSPWPDAELDPIAVRDVPIDNRRLLCDPLNPPWEYVY